VIAALISAGTLVEATVRTTVGDYIYWLARVYSLVIFAYIVSTWIISFGVRIPYSSATNAVLTFLRDVSEPYLRIFRRVLPPFGGLDLSPIIALLVLNFLAQLIGNAVHG
jgi:YggT family protein